ncbi:MAG: bifunctional metallophosphatase/5'-nucleotidase [Candidatus Cloacimonetes bacterium]|nr:bifunctional metallophosphatase/5'-nucleotidase [Candidatus Cloacimonadota bacterium]
MKIIFYLLPLLLLSITFSKDIHIFYSTDLHGYAFPYRDQKTHIKYGSLASMATILEQRQADNKSILFFDSGDAFQGTLIDRVTQGQLISDILNDPILSYTARVLGNHDFDYGTHITRERFSRSSHPIMALNIKAKSPIILDYLHDYALVKRDGITFGIFGLIDKHTPKNQIKSNIEGLEFEDETIYVKKMPKFLRDKGADVVVMLAHIGFFRTKASPHQHTVSNRPQLLNQILTQDDQDPVHNIDILLDGHSHDLIYKDYQEDPSSNNDNTIITQAGYYGMHLGELVVSFEGKEIKKVKQEFHLLDVKKYPPSKTFLNKFSKLRAQQIKLNQKLVAKVKRGFFLENDMEAKPQANDAVNLTTQAYYEMAQSKGMIIDLAFVNVFGVRNHFFSRVGKITYSMLHKVSPFRNTLQIYDLTGQQILDILKHKGRRLGFYGAQMSISKEEYLSQKDGYSPNSFTFIKDGVHTKLELNKVYRVISPNYTAQTDNFLIHKYKKNVEKTDILDIDALQSFLKSETKKDPKLSSDKYLLLKDRSLTITDR